MSESETAGRETLTAARRLRLLRVACAALWLTDKPRGKNRLYRLTLWLLEERYQAAESLGGRDLARTYDYIPF